MDTLQGLLSRSGDVSKQMYKFASGINFESIVLVKGIIKKSPIKIEATSVKDAEIHINEVSRL
jgi:aspartyl-tRNA synthetase